MRRQHLEFFAVGVIVGAVFGVVAGLLFAPASGAATRRKLADGATRVAEAARGVADRAERTAEQLTLRVDHYLGRDEEVAWRKVAEIREGVQRYTRAHTEP